MIGSANCIYETPCGWCSKWDKKCDKKIQEQGVVVNTSEATVESITNKVCKSDFDHDWECVGVSTGGSTYRCRNCYTTKTISPNHNLAWDGR